MNRAMERGEEWGEGGGGRGGGEKKKGGGIEEPVRRKPIIWGGGGFGICEYSDLVINHGLFERRSRAPEMRVGSSQVFNLRKNRDIRVSSTNPCFGGSWKNGEI